MDIVLETERLILRKPVMEDAEEMSRYNEREDFYRYIPIEPPTRDSTKAFVEKIINQNDSQDEEEIHFSIVEKITGNFLGHINIFFNDKNLRHIGCGYGINPEYWGKGYVTEALKELIDFGFNKLKIKRICMTSDKRNKASWRVMEKCGLKYEGCHRSEGFSRGAYYDRVYYSILDTDLV